MIEFHQSLDRVARFINPNKRRRPPVSSGVGPFSLRPRHSNSQGIHRDKSSFRGIAVAPRFDQAGRVASSSSSSFPPKTAYRNLGVPAHWCSLRKIYIGHRQAHHRSLLLCGSSASKRHGHPVTTMIISSPTPTRSRRFSLSDVHQSKVERSRSTCLGAGPSRPHQSR
jgi:hypothetical protein